MLTVLNIVYSPQITLHITHSILPTVNCTLHFSNTKSGMWSEFIRQKLSWSRVKPSKGAIVVSSLHFCETLLHTLHTIQTLYTAHCTLSTLDYTAHCTLSTLDYTAHCILSTLDYTAHCTLSTLGHPPLHTGHCGLYIT